MYFEFNGEQAMWHKTVHDFVDKEFGREYYRQCDQERRYRRCRDQRDHIERSIPESHIEPGCRNQDSGDPMPSFCPACGGRMAS